jgi:hypothetical protein
MPYSVSEIATEPAGLLTPELQSLIAGKVAALRSEAGLAAILDGIGEGFYAVDGDWRIILFNEEAARHFRRAPEQMPAASCGKRSRARAKPVSAGFSTKLWQAGRRSAPRPSRWCFPAAGSPTAVPARRRHGRGVPRRDKSNHRRLRAALAFVRTI